MKTLYSILGVDSGATTAEIEKAYSSFLTKLQTGNSGLSSEEINNQMYAIREAHTTLTNPILRQRYDQKLLESSIQYLDTRNDHAQILESKQSFGLKAILLVGILVLAGIYLYNEKAKEREKLRIQQEHEVQMKTIQIAEEKQKQDASVQHIILDKVASQSDAQKLLIDQHQFERESAQRQQVEIQRQRLETQQQQQQLREEENRQRQEQQRRQQQLQSEKRLLQQMERDRYGKVITY
ncbi:DnaJ domain-containing protein [Propionivibrio sp.]|uniref:DnaJ domain-containing protein n=1 Tax=Propionivibrio sp. TaxID=2212460 RepID=UPI0025FAF05E|nr:DnaJ domain-containing protein [Propionivibrio sp.]MBK8745230.1 DnaJ domain-containing protein [Propionivibrio sp.]